MKISPLTTKILENFATINTGIKFNKNNHEIRTISKGDNIIVKAKIEETFGETFCIDQLGRVLSVLRLLGGDADVSVDSTDLIIKGSEFTSRVRRWHEEAIHLPPEGDIDLGPAVISFNIPTEKIRIMMKGAKLHGSPTYGFIADGKTVVLRSFDDKNDSSDVFETTLAETTKKFKLYIAVEAIDTIIPGPYTVTFYDGAVKVVTFKHAEIDLEYLFALKVDSELTSDDNGASEGDDDDE